MSRAGGCRSFSLGFTLVEIMVGMLIGLFGVIIMLQVFQTAEAQKRTTTSSGDAVSNGAMAFYILQRDLRQAGYGFSEADLLGCSLQLGGGLAVAMVPVTINPAAFAAIGDANTDTLLIMYGNPNGSPQGDGITTQPATNTYAVQTLTSFFAGDWIVATPGTRANPCTLTLDWVTTVGAANLTVNAGVVGLGTGATLFNLGRRSDQNGANQLVIRGYAIRNGSLASCDYIDYTPLATGGNPTILDCAQAANWNAISENIVSLRAQYGRDAATTTQTTDNTTQTYITSTWDQTSSATACGWIRTLALRYALVARATQQEGGVTTTSPSWEGAAANPVVLTGLANWQNYRYKLFESIAPLRNVAWIGYKAGC